MQVGVVYPQTELDPGPEGIASFARSIEKAGYRHLLAYDHVLGADPEAHSPWKGPYDIDTPFQELFVLFGFLAGTTDLELVSGVLVLPQRQTALVAKQAAQVDVLSGGRLRLGVGVGWNRVEYSALGEDFTTRGRRMDEQIVLLRRLWTEPSVSFDGEFDSIDAAGIRPMPVQKPIPIWVGGRSPAAYRRIGALADGWIPEMKPGPELDEALDLIKDSAIRAGRDPSALGMDARVSWQGDMSAFLDEVRTWRDLGATHLSVNTMRAGLDGVDAHCRVLDDVADELKLVGHI